MSNIYTQIATDNFTRANSSTLGANWTTPGNATNSPQIIGNLCYEASSLTFQNWSFWNANSFPNDQYAQINANADHSGGSNGAIQGVFLRQAASGAGYSVSLSDTSGIFRVTTSWWDASGVETVIHLVNVTSPASATVILRAEVQGSTITAFYKGVQVDQQTDSTYTSGSAGVRQDGGANWGVGTWSAGGIMSGLVGSGYSVPDCRTYATFPNADRLVNGTLVYDVQTSSNHAIPPTDSRAAGAPVASGSYPQNSRTPGTFGPGE